MVDELNNNGSDRVEGWKPFWDNDSAAHFHNWPTLGVNAFSASGSTKLSKAEVRTLAELSKNLGGLVSLEEATIASAFGGIVPDRVEALIDSLRSVMLEAERAEEQPARKAEGTGGSVSWFSRLTEHYEEAASRFRKVAELASEPFMPREHPLMSSWQVSGLRRTRRIVDNPPGIRLGLGTPPAVQAVMLGCHPLTSGPGMPLQASMAMG